MTDTWLMTRQFERPAHTHAIVNNCMEVEMNLLDSRDPKIHAKWNIENHYK